MMNCMESSGINFSYGGRLNDFVAATDKESRLEGGIGKGQETGSEVQELGLVG